VRIILFALVVAVVACNNDSSNGVEIVEPQSAYASFDELKRLQPCEASLNSEIAHVAKNNLDYICIYDCNQGTFSWVVYSSEATVQNCIEETKSASVSSSSLISSSSTYCGYADCNCQILKSNEFCDERDGSVYKYVTIAPLGSGYSQVWMAENLSYRTNSTCSFSFSRDYVYYNGNFTDFFFNQDEYDAYVGDITTFKEEFKYTYYNWDDANDVCPKGWRLPTLTDWITLFSAIGDSPSTKLKAVSGWKLANISIAGIYDKHKFHGNGTDDYGFSVYPGGTTTNDCSGYLPRISISVWNEGEQAVFWTATENNPPYDQASAYTIVLDSYQSVKDSLQMEYDFYETQSKSLKASVRCIKE